MLTLAVILGLGKLCYDQYLEDKATAIIEDYEKHYFKDSGLTGHAT
jgi:hypothetical protein